MRPRIIYSSSPKQSITHVFQFIEPVYMRRPRELPCHIATPYIKYLLLSVFFVFLIFNFFSSTFAFLDAEGKYQFLGEPYSQLFQRMKYGQSLGKYSVPEWRSHNILYDELKIQIKELTVSANAFSRSGYEQLADFFANEIENTNLFVRCKLGEIDYRFQQCDLAVRDLAKAPEDERRYWQFSGEVQKLNQDIRNLSRFVGAQYTGFQKLLKKYRRYAPTRDLSAKGRDLAIVDKLLLARDSFARIDLTPQFLELSMLYSTLRTRNFSKLAFQHRQHHDFPPKHSAGSLDKKGNDSSAPEFALLESKFDAEMLMIISSDVFRYWVHPDNLVQVKVMLLQNLDLVATDDESESTRTIYLDTDSLDFAQNLGEPAQIRQICRGELFSRPTLLVPVGGLRHTTALELGNEQFEALKRGDFHAHCVASPSKISAQFALGWVCSQKATPKAEVCVHRTRFRSDDGVFASIDTSPLIQGDCSLEPRLCAFPYSILEIRTKRDVAWLDRLRKSHLLYPVSASFSLYEWALHRTRPEQVVARPGWLDVLDSGAEIRQEPSEAVNKPQGLAKSHSSTSLQFDELARPKPARYWNEFDDGDESVGEGLFFEEIDEELRRARIAANFARPVYQLGETMRRQFNTWFDPARRSLHTSDIGDSDTIISNNSSYTESSSLLRHQRSEPYSPRIASCSNSIASYGSLHSPNLHYGSSNQGLVRKKHDQGLALITFLCFFFSLSMVGLVFLILITEDVIMLPLALRVLLIVFLVIALALALLGYVAFNFRSSQHWSAQATVHVVLLTVVCFGVGGVANISMSRL